MEYPLKTYVKYLLGFDPVEKEISRHVRMLVRKTWNVFGLGKRYPAVKFSPFTDRSRANINKIVFCYEEIKIIWKYRFKPVLTFLEYREYAHDKDIGDARRITGEEYLRILTAHELAHVIHLRISGLDYRMEKEEKELRKFWCEKILKIPENHRLLRDRADHGLLWRSIYAVLRKFLLNKLR